MLRDNHGRFAKGNKGFWFGKKRLNLTKEKNPRWIGGNTNRECLVCHKIFPTRGKRRVTAKFCSHSCRAKWNFTGVKNPKWRGGIPREKRTELPEYNKWRISVYRRDNWQCQICGYKGRLLVAHHIKIWLEFPKERFNLNNGITLCRACHCKLHTIHKKVIDFREILRDYTLSSERR